MKLGRYEHGFSIILTFFFVGFSVSSGDQKGTMLDLSRTLNNSNWNTTDRNHCLWSGVKCDKNYSVTHLSLSRLSFSSSDFLVELCKIRSLQSLDVSENLLVSIPDRFLEDCGKIVGLKSLNFSRNKLVGSLPKFDPFPGLESLDLSYNFLNGSLHAKFGTKKNLSTLHLSHNLLVGRIPDEIMNFENLIFLDLGFNNLSSFIPDSIWKLRKLETLVLESNRFTGTIPAKLTEIKTLKRFVASQNELNGKIPQKISEYLKILDLSYNNLTGSIPVYLLSPRNLRIVDLSSNKIEGLIPTNLSESLIRLSLSNNLLEGTMAMNVSALKNLTYLSLNDNKLTGEIPKDLRNCVSLALLNLANNQLEGILPRELGDLDKLISMKLQSNRLTGDIPTDYKKLVNLIVLNLSGNMLSGSIPPWISELQKLSNLHLEENKFNGSIPSSISNLNSLIELQLGSNDLNGFIPKMPSRLQIALNLSKNHFTGPIPDSSLSFLTDLEILDLSNNQFTGEISLTLTKMSSLTLLDLSYNNFSGVLPKFRKSLKVITTGNKDLAESLESTPTTNTESRKHSSAIVIFSAIAGALLILGLLALIVVLLSKRYYYQIDDEYFPSIEQLPRVIKGRVITSNRIHRSAIDFKRAVEEVSNPSSLLIKGRFSNYYSVLIPSGLRYIVKKVNRSVSIFQLHNHERFEQELQMLGSLNNSNVMIPLAYVSTFDEAYLFYEDAHYRTLNDLLHKNQDNHLDWPCRYRIALGVARGLAFLHGCAKPILLLDLSTNSILMKSSNEPQICDVELLKIIDPSKSTGSLSTVAGSVGYIPPEYAYTMRVTAPGNVYSFGVILLELLTGKPPVGEDIDLVKWVFSKPSSYHPLDRIFDSRVCRTAPSIRKQMTSLLKIAKVCVNSSPEARPDMKSVERMILNAR